MLVWNNERINPETEYKLCSDFYTKDLSHNIVYVIQPEESGNFAVDYNKIPFNNGTVEYISKQSYMGNLQQVKIGNEFYNVTGGHSFDKGKYCGRQYELVRKIAYINKNLRAGELPLYSNVELTHQGDAITVSGGRRYCVTLNTLAIQKAYFATCFRNLFRCGEQSPGFAYLFAVAAGSLVGCMGASLLKKYGS